ncbi:MAG: isopeptide-forming domain-containing fimbrial protein, partial [Janthinobacterium lividum]
ECTTNCETETPVTDPSVRYAKTADATGSVKVGDTITYTLTAEVLNAQLTEVFTLTDTLGTGLTFGGVSDAGAFSCSGTLSCTLPVGTVPGTYSLTYTATVNDQAIGSVKNAVVGTGSNPECTTNCETETPVTDPSVRYAKTADATGSVKVGDTITYTLTAVVENAQLTEVFTLTDTLGTGLTFGGVSDAGAFSCSGTLSCTLPVGTVPGTYSLTYTATVNDQAIGSVKNAVVGTGSNPECTTNCEVITPVMDPAVRYSKSADVTEAVKVGDTITYTLTAVVENAQLTEVFTLTDTLGTGLTFGSVSDAGAFTCTGSLSCTLPVGTVPGTYELVYTASVNADAAGTVKNAVVGTGSNASCENNCEVITPVEDPKIDIVKTIDLIEGQKAKVGDVLTYMVTATVSGSSLRSELTVTDTLGAGLDFGSVTVAGAYTCNAANPLVCTLPPGTAPGTYAVTYTAIVNASAQTQVRNAVVGTSDDEVNCVTCDVVTEVEAPIVRINKSANPLAGSKVQVGQLIDYTVSVVVERSALISPLTLTDTPSEGLTLLSTPQDCVLNGNVMTCTLPVGTPAGTYDFTYQGRVEATAGAKVANAVRGETDGSTVIECGTCSVEHEVEEALVRLTKTAGSRDVKVGDLVRYTLTIENLSGPNLINAQVVDTPAAGFTYVEGSLQVVDADDFGSVTGSNPILISGLDVASGETATVSYLMRVGAGVTQGTHINSAIVQDGTGRDLSNRARRGADER